MQWSGPWLWKRCCGGVCLVCVLCADCSCIVRAFSVCAHVCMCVCWGGGCACAWVLVYVRVGVRLYCNRENRGPGRCSGGRWHSHACAAMLFACVVHKDVHSHRGGGSALRTSAVLHDRKASSPWVSVLSRVLLPEEVCLHLILRFVARRALVLNCARSVYACGCACACCACASVRMSVRQRTTVWVGGWGSPDRPVYESEQEGNRR